MEDIISETEKQVHEEELIESESENNNNSDEGDEIKGGIITQLISNIVSPMSPKAADFGSSNNGDSNNGESEEEDLAKNGGVMKKQDDDDENSKGGLIDHIVSHFPTSIPDDAVPTTDEASILIHSLVKD